MEMVQTGTSCNLKNMAMHTFFKDYHFLELQDDNGDVVGIHSNRTIQIPIGPICTTVGYHRPNNLSQNYTVGGLI